jgi:inorganic triphosphatase YgiF
VNRGARVDARRVDRLRRWTTEKTLERELKLEAGEEVELEALGGRALDARTFTSVYYDTPQRRLLRLGIILRRRTENGVGTWQLKLPRTGTSSTGWQKRLGRYVTST